MSQALLDLIKSKKFWTAVVGIVAVLTARLGLHVDDATQAEIVGIIVTLIGAQGLADHGKEAAAIASAKPLGRLLPLPPRDAA
jgi:uncharacterized membrane protein